MPLLDDHRLDLQKTAIATHLAGRAERGQITGSLDYTNQARLWLERLSHGQPLTVPSPVTDADRAVLADLLDFLMTVDLDLSVQDQMAQELLRALQSHREQVLRASRGWDQQLDVLTGHLEAVRRRYQSQSAVTVTEPFTRTTTGTLGRDATIDEGRGVLTLRPVADTRATPALRQATVTIYPTHHPDGGVAHTGPDGLDPARHPRSLVDGAGFERWVLADIPPSVLLDGTTYEGVVATIDLLYDGAISFTGIELKPRGTYPLDVVRVQARAPGEAGWLDVLTSDRHPLTGTTDGVYWVHGLPRTTATQVRVWVRQAHPESRTPMGGDAALSAASLSQLERAIRPHDPVPQSRTTYVIGVYRLHLVDVAYPSQGVGVFWSHPPTSTQGYDLPHAPIETVSVTAETAMPHQSTIDWWIRDVDRNTMIPVLPVGTTRVRERAVFLSDDDLALTFPIARGTTPQVFVNGIPLDHAQFPFTEVNSTRWRSARWSPSGHDAVTVEYTPALGQTVMVYVLKSRTGDALSVRTLTSNNAVFPNRLEADLAIAESTDPIQLESYGVLARLDEFDTWFLGGTRKDNIGYTALTIPRILPHPDLLE